GAACAVPGLHLPLDHLGKRAARADERGGEPLVTGQHPGGVAVRTALVTDQPAHAALLLGVLPGLGAADRLDHTGGGRPDALPDPLASVPFTGPPADHGPAKNRPMALPSHALSTAAFLAAALLMNSCAYKHKQAALA